MTDAKQLAEDIIDDLCEVHIDIEPDQFHSGGVVPIEYLRRAVNDVAAIIAPHLLDDKKLARVMWKNRHGESYDEYAWLSFTSEDELLTYLTAAIKEFRERKK